jgi:hypothetical protein
LVFRSALFLVTLLSLAPAARAIELRLQFGALERMLGEQVFTQDGRRYVHNDSKNKCNFAYLEKPRIQGQEGKLRIRARFTGRSSLNMFGKCVGLGDAFDVVITALPQYKDGNIGLNDVKAAAEGHTGYYIRRVCDALTSSLLHSFRYPVAAAAKSLLEDPGAQKSYPRELGEFRVTDIQVSNDALVLVIDFALTVK